MSDDAEQFFNAWVGVFGNSRAKKNALLLACGPRLEEIPARANSCTNRMKRDLPSS